jgi:hypothetical protein
MERQYGYYIHGQTPNGTSDINMKEMLLNMERESEQLIGTRGLQPNSNTQTFIVRITSAFRSQYDSFSRGSRVRQVVSNGSFKSRSSIESNEQLS